MPQFSGVETAIAVLAAAIAALAAYLTADLVVYPRYGNIPALILDVIITGAVLLEMSYVLDFSIPIKGLAAIIALIGLGEWYYHRYIKVVLFSRRRR